MRKALFCVILVAASFAGGAVVNGPGLHWAKAMVIDRLGLADTGERHLPPPSDAIPPLAVEPSELPSGGPGTNPNDATPETRAALKSSSDRPEGGSVRKVSSRPPSSEPTTALEPDPLAEVKAKAKALPALAPVPTPAATPDTEPLPLPLDDTPSPKRAVADAAEKPLPSEPTDGARKSQPSEPIDVVVKPLPNEPTDGAVNPTARRPLASDGGVGGSAGEWAEIRRLLKAAGVSRYGIEAEPGGRARFQCVIPLAGRRAVGQHFEAEGDDEIQAARAALKRITLWRATGDPSDAP